MGSIACPAIAGKESIMRSSWTFCTHDWLVAALFLDSLGKIQNLSNQKKKKESADTRGNDKNFTESHLLVKRPKANKFQALLAQFSTVRC